MGSLLSKSGNSSPTTTTTACPTSTGQSNTVPEVSEDVSVEDESVLDVSVDSVSVEDGSVADMSVEDASAEDDSVDDASVPSISVEEDSSFAEESVAEVSSEDASVEDISVENDSLAEVSSSVAGVSVDDVSVADVSVADASVAASVADVSIADVSVADVSVADVSVADVSIADVSFEEFPEVSVQKQSVIKKAPPPKTCDKSPVFAIICSFLDHFGELVGANDIGFDELQKMIENKRRVPQRLVRFHIDLLKNHFGTDVSPFAWERYLFRFSNSCGYSEECRELEVEEGSYRRLKLETKLKLLNALLESQFDCDPAFKSQINKMQPSNIRQQPLGRDKSGNVYWSQVDSVSDDVNLKVRVYRENGEEWDTIMTDKDGLDKLAGELKARKMAKITCIKILP